MRAKAAPLQALGHRASRQRRSIPSRTRTTTRTSTIGLKALYRLRLLIHQERLYPGENLGRDECYYGCDSLTILQF